MDFAYIKNRLVSLKKDLEDAKCFGQEAEYHEDLETLKDIIQGLNEHIRKQRNDSAFFEKELEDKQEPKWSPVVEEYRKRRQKRLDAKAEGRWITTENNHHIHLNEEGVPDKGNPHVIEAMSGKVGSPKHSISSAEDAKKHRENTSKLKDAVTQSELMLERFTDGLKEKEEEKELHIKELKEHSEYWKDILDGKNYEDVKKSADELQSRIDEIRDQIKNHKKEYGPYSEDMPKEVWDERKKLINKEVELEDEYDDKYERLLLGFRDIEDIKKKIAEDEDALEYFKSKKSESEEELKKAKNRYESSVAEYKAYFDERNKKTLERIKSPYDIESTEDATDYLKAKGYFDGDPMEIDENVNLDGIHKTCAFETVRSLEKICEDYPFLTGKLKGIKTVENEGMPYKDREAYAYATGKSIVLNKAYYNDPMKIESEYKGSVESGWSVSGTEYPSVIDHEFGHVVEFFLNEKLNGKRASDIVAQRVAMRRFELSSPEDADEYPEYYDFIRSSVSRYSVDNYGTRRDERGELVYKNYGENTEVFAEGFAGGRCSESPNATVKMIHEEINKLVKEVFG